MNVLAIGRLQIYWDGWEWWKDWGYAVYRIHTTLNLGPLSVNWKHAKPINHP